MKKLIIAFAALSMAAPASAEMTYFLVAQWFQNGNQMCEYSNGTVLNVGVRVCPLSIRA